MPHRGPKPKDRISRTPLPGSPEPPKDLDPAGRKRWREIAGWLDKAGLLSLMDADLLTLYCAVWSRWVEARKMVSAEGAVIQTPNGYSQKNPWMDIEVQSQKDLKSYLTQMGMSPLARSKFMVADDLENDGGDKWADLD